MMADKPRETEKRPRRRFLSAASVILAVMVIGDVVGRLVVKMRWRLEAGEGLALKDWLLFAFFVSSAGWLWLIRRPLVRFFRSMYAGVALVVLTTLSVAVGVLVPQMDGFEDVRQRITDENREEQYDAFRWAEGYFFYHLTHLYGVGMPEADIPAPALASLDDFGRRYGLEERDNREKRMEAAFTGQAKTREIGDFIRKHDGKFRTFFNVCTFLQLNRAYKSAWFATLLGLLGTAIFLNTFTGKPRRWVSIRRVGFFVTHCGMLVLLVGGLVSKLRTERGIMHLDLRDGPRDEFALNYDRFQRARLPFHVGLERFARKEWLQLEVDFPEDGFTSRPPSYTLWPGRVIDLDYVEDEHGGLRPRRRLRVRELHDRVEVETRLAETREGADVHDGPAGLGVGALAEFVLTPGGSGGDDLDHPDHPGHEAHAPATQIIRRVPALPPYATLSDPEWEFRVRTSYGPEEPDELFALFPTDDGTIGTLFVRERTGNEASETPYPIRVGGTVDLPGGYGIEVREAVPDFQLDRHTGAEIRDGRPLAERVPSNPAVICWITPPDGGEPERRLVRQNVDAVSQGLQADYTYPGLELYLLWDEWRAPGPERYFLHWGPELDPVLVAEDGTVTPVEPGAALPLGSSTELSLTRFFRRAVFSRDVRFAERDPPVPGAVDLDFYSRDRRGLSLDIVFDPDTEDERVENVELVTDADMSSTWRDEVMTVTFFENTALMPFEWRSVLSIHEPGPDGKLVKVDTGTERESEIRVNDYFKWEGYRFFQTNADPDFPTYSGIGIVFDPGIPIVLAGMYTIIAGTILAFIVRPIVRSREKQEEVA